MNINKRIMEFITLRDRMAKELRLPDTGATDALAVELYLVASLAEVADRLEEISAQISEGS